MIGDHMSEIAAMGALGNASFVLGDTSRAIEYYEGSLDIAREIGQRQGEANALNNLGLVSRDLGETRRAIEFFETISGYQAGNW